MKRPSLQARIGEVLRRHHEAGEFSQEGFADHEGKSFRVSMTNFLDGHLALGDHVS